MRVAASRVAVALGVVAAVVAVGAGASAFGPSRSDVVAYELDAQGAVDASGANASPGPTPSAANIEPTPSTSAAPTPTPSKNAKTGCKQGDKQLVVEQSLAQIKSYGPVTVDGKQSQEDCAAIKKFQSRFGIRPVDGQAGRTTADVARRIAGSLTAAERANPASRRRPARSRSTIAPSRRGRTRTRSGCRTGSTSPGATASTRPRHTSTTRPSARTAASTCCTATRRRCGPRSATARP